MNRFYLLAAILGCVAFFSCSSKQPRSETPHPADSARGFFETFEHDLVSTSKVISNNELIKNLTHLQRMDSGGSHYYPLEREALTNMIQALSSYTYADCILLNMSGTVIYTMYDNKLLAKKAESFPSSLSILFRHAKEGEPYLLDIAEFPEMAGPPRLIFAVPVKRGLETEGVLIAAITAEDTAKIIHLKGRALDQTGVVRLSAVMSELFTRIPEFQTVTASDNERKITASGTRLFPMTFRNLQWYFTVEQ